MQLIILIPVITSILSLFGVFSNLALPESSLINSRLLIALLICLPAALYCLSRFVGPGRSDSSSKTKGSVPQNSLPETVCVYVWFTASILFCLLNVNGRNASDSGILANSEAIRWSAILAPILGSISLFWFSQAIWQSKKVSQAIGETLCRLKVYFLMTLIPLFLLLGLKDATGSFTGQPQVILQMTLLPCGLILTVVFMPHIVCWILPSISIKKTALGKQLLNLANDSGTPLSDVRIWGTGNRIVNAFVVGMLPFGRTVLLTDRLAQEFDHDELKAVFLHELGHVKHNHLIQRLAAAATPFFFTFAIGQLCHLPEIATIGLSIAASLTGLGIVARFLEFEADEFAANELIRLGYDSGLYVDILQRIQTENPNSNKSSWLHPQISDRILRLRKSLPVAVRHRGDQL